MKTAPAFTLGVNIDHVATLRRLRDTPYPSLVDAARECVAGGADQITVHLREDRRHIVDADVANLKAMLTVPMNLEMAATDEMLAIALKTKPHIICLVPEKREERTTEGGLDLSTPQRLANLQKIVRKAADAGIHSSLFIEPSAKDVEKAREMGAYAVEFHTGTLCIAIQNKKPSVEQEWKRLETAVDAAVALGVKPHAGHGIDEEIATQLTRRVPKIIEYNIGHAIICQAVFCGLREATKRMKTALSKGLQA